MIVVIYGPDGSGKSTVIEHITKEIDCNIEHFRPKVSFTESYIHTKKINNERPYQSEPYGFFTSLLKIFYNFFIFQFVRLRDNNNIITIYDRYYYDLLIDQKRMRLDGFKFLIRFLAFFVKKPDLTFVLVGSGVVINKRKNELSVEEIDFLCCKYKKIKANKIFDVDTLDAKSISEYILQKIVKYEE